MLCSLPSWLCRRITHTATIKTGIIYCKYTIKFLISIQASDVGEWVGSARSDSDPVDHVYSDNQYDWLNNLFDREAIQVQHINQIDILYWYILSFPSSLFQPFLSFSPITFSLSLMPFLFQPLYQPLFLSCYLLRLSLLSSSSLYHPFSHFLFFSSFCPQPQSPLRAWPPM